MFETNNLSPEAHSAVKRDYFEHAASALNEIDHGQRWIGAFSLIN